MNKLKRKREISQSKCKRKKKVEEEKQINKNNKLKQ